MTNAQTPHQTPQTPSLTLRDVAAGWIVVAIMVLGAAFF